MDYGAASYGKFVDARQCLEFADERDAAGWPMEFVRRTVLRQGVSALVGLAETSWHENLAAEIGGLPESVVQSKGQISTSLLVFVDSSSLTPMLLISSSTSLERAPQISGAAGKPTYFAIPERIETSALYAVC